MDTLFPIGPEPGDIPPIPGFHYAPNFLHDAQEEHLLREIDALPWDVRLERRRQPYGYGYAINKGEAPHIAVPIPSWGMELAARLQSEGFSDELYNQMLVNEYLPGQGIAMHIDYEPFGRSIAMISLGSAYVMDFIHTETAENYSLLLEPRSVLIVQDEARYVWQHGIARRKTDLWKGVRLQRGRRVSITFRHAPV